MKEKNYIIENIIFTKREIDVVACVLHAKSDSRIADILSISPKTVSCHVSNILAKTNMNSREYISSFVERNVKVKELRNHYGGLLVRHSFEKLLKEIGKLLKKEEIVHRVCLLDYNKKNKNVLKKIEQDLCLANLRLKINKTSSSKLRLDDLKDANDYSNYVIDVIKNHSNLDSLLNHIKAFEERRKKLFEAYSFSQSEKKVNKENLSIKKNNFALKKKHSILVFLCIVLLVTIYGFFQHRFYYTATKIESWGLPPPSQYTVTRKAMQKKILNAFHDKKQYVDITLFGEPGSGKTTIATQAILKANQGYKFRGWFKSESPTLIETEYLNLGLEKNLFTQEMNRDQKIVAVKKWLENKQPILLVYDNVEDYEAIQKYIPKKGHVLLTSRNPFLPHQVMVDSMTPEESVDVLKKLLPKQEFFQNFNHLNTIAKKMNYFPLALSQAAAYMAQRMVSPEEYLRLFEKDKALLLSIDAMPPNDKHKPAYWTWNLIYNRMYQNQEEHRSLELLKLLFLFYPEDIPKDLLILSLYGKNTPQTKIKFLEALHGLSKKSLIRNELMTISIHRMYHGWIEGKLNLKEKSILAQKVLENIQEELLKNSTNPNILMDLAMYIPHLKSIWENVNTKKLTSNTHALLFTLGKWYNELGFYNESRKYLEKSLKARTSLSAGIEVKKDSFWHLYI